MTRNVLVLLLSVNECPVFYGEKQVTQRIDHQDVAQQDVAQQQHV